MARQSKGITLPIVYKADLDGLKKAESALGQFGKVAATVGAAAVAAVTGVAVAGVRAFAGFDAKLQESVAIMGDVSDAMRNQMSDAAREVAKNTTFSAEQAAESYFFLASAGLDAQQSIAALPKVAAFAQAGMFDMATATDLLTDAQSALGLTSEDAAENLENMANLGDILVKANTLANASVSQFSEALTNKAAASMRSLNMETETGVAVLAVFADQGIKGSQAGTTFNATIRGLTNGVRTNAAEFAAMGVEVFNAEGAMNNMADIVAQLEAGLDGMSVEQQRATLSQMGFTEETLAGALALIGNSEAIREYEKELRNASGTVDEVAAKQLETFNGQLELLKSQFNDVAIEVGSKLVPILVDLMKELGPVVEEIGTLIADVFAELAPSISMIVEQIPPLIRAFSPLIPIIGRIAQLFAEALVKVMPTVVEIFERLFPVLEKVFDVILDVVDQALPIFLDLFALAADLLLPIVETILPILAELFALLAPIVLEVVDAFMPLVEALLPVFVDIFEALAPLILKVVEAFMPIVEATLPLFIKLVEELTPLLSILAEFLGVVIVANIEKLGSFLEWLIGKAFDLAKWFVQHWYDMTVATTKLQNKIIEGVENLANNFVRGMNRMIQGVNRLRQALGEAPLQMVAEVSLGRIPMPELPQLLWPVVPVTVGSVGSAYGSSAAAARVGRGVTGSAYNLSAGAIPAMAAGGLVSRPTLALIGEAGPEAVIPLDKMPQGGTVYNITVNAGLGTNGTQLGAEIVSLIKRYERSSGPVFVSA